MKKCALFIIGFMIIFCGCGKDYFHDTGLANGKHDCTIWEYMQQDRENWDSTILVIKRAGLQSLFDGTDGENKEITFFGPTNMSIMQFLFKTVDEEYEMMYSSIDDIPVEICRQFILSHVIREKWLSTDFEFENKGDLDRRIGGNEFGRKPVAHLSDKRRVHGNSRHRGRDLVRSFPDIRTHCLDRFIKH